MSAYRFPSQGIGTTASKPPTNGCLAGKNARLIPVPEQLSHSRFQLAGNSSWNYLLDDRIPAMYRGTMYIHHVQHNTEVRNALLLLKVSNSV